MVMPDELGIYSGHCVLEVECVGRLYSPSNPYTLAKENGQPLWVLHVLQLRRNLVGLVEFCARVCFVSFLL